MAGRIPDAWFDELRNRLNIVDVVSDYVTLKQKGRKFWGLCPFHGEKTASFSVDSELQTYYCFGCHKGGSMIGFVMEIERMEFMEAVKLLSDKAHLPLPEHMEEERGTSREVKERILEANVEAARYYHSMLWTPEGAKALAYLHKRGLDDVGIRRFGLGAAPDGWDNLVRHLGEKGFEPELLKQAGLCGEKDGRYFDMFRDRAIFPIVNGQGRVLGFGGRIMGDGQPKYLNTSDTPVFNKRQEIYAHNMVRKERGLKRVILVEGYMDVVSLRNRGVPGVVATLGTALTEQQARLIKRLAPVVYVCYDGDSAGQKAILRALDIFEAEDAPARVLDIPDQMDPDDYVKAFGAEGFEALRPIPPAEYRMLRAADGKDLSLAEDRMQYAIECCGILRRLKDPVEVASYLPNLAIQTGFTQEVLSQQIGAMGGAPGQSRAGEANAAPKPRLSRRREEKPDYVKAEMSLIYMTANQLVDPAYIDEAVFVTPLYRKMFAMLKAGEKTDTLMYKLSDEETGDAAEALSTDRKLDRENAADAMKDCLNRLNIHRLQEKIDRTRQQYKEAPQAERAPLIRLLQELTNEMNQAKAGRKE